MIIRSITPVAPGLFVSIRIEFETGDADFEEKFRDFPVLGWAVVRAPGERESDVIEPMFLDDEGLPVVLSQYEAKVCQEKNWSDTDYQIVDESGNHPDNKSQEANL